MLAFTFTALAVIHFYWACGGQWGLHAVIPTNLSGTKMLNPGTLITLGVGLSLLLVAGLYGAVSKEFKWGVLTRIKAISYGIVPLVFLLRAVGDFKYVGFFKVVNTTEFAFWDSVFFTPLCVLISLLGFLLLRLSAAGFSSKNIL